VTMTNKIKDILNFRKSIPQSDGEPIETIELGNGYVLVHTHIEVPDVSERALGYTGVDFYEVRHPSYDHIIAGLTGMSGKDIEPVIKVGVIQDEHKALGMSKNVFDALTQKYGTLPKEAGSFLRTAWGDPEESPSISASDKIGSWEKISEIIDTFKALRKSDQDDKTQMVKVNGHTGWHKLLDIKDSGTPSEKGGGNHYTFLHNKTQEAVAVHQNEVTDMAFAHELKKVSYHRRPGAKSLQKFAAGAPGLINAGATGTAAISKIPVDKKVVDGSMLNKASDEKESKLMSLSGQTQVGVDPYSGKRAFLLFRGMKKDEFASTVQQDSHVDAKNQAVWSPYPDIAMDFSPDGYLVGAWVSEDNLILQALSPDKQFDPEHQHMSLYKVMVKPHVSQVLSSEQTKIIIKQINGVANA
jgi:hypothetical protein